MEEDPRYKIATKEAKIGIGLSLFYVVWWTLFGFGIGKRGPTNYNYILGFPDWFFYSVLLGWILFSIIVYIVVTKYFKGVPFDTTSIMEGKLDERT